MMNKGKGILIGIVVLVVIFFMMGPFYTVDEGELAVVIRFGKIVNQESEAGLKFKMPLLDKIQKYSKKIQSWDGDAKVYPTEENQLIWVDTTARWRISNPKLFYESMRTITNAQSRLDDYINSSARDIIAKHLLREAVRNSNHINEIERKDVYGSQAGDEDGEISSVVNTFTKVTYEPIQKGRGVLSEEMLTSATKESVKYGIELIDVIVRQLKYSDDITQNVYKQMIKERNQIAQALPLFRAKVKKQKWLGKTEKELREIRSGAERTAKEKKAKADAEALDIRNKAYTQDAGFADFWMALVQYRKVLPKMKKTLTTGFRVL